MLPKFVRVRCRCVPVCRQQRGEVMLSCEGRIRCYGFTVEGVVTYASAGDRSSSKTAAASGGGDGGDSDSSEPGPATPVPAAVDDVPSGRMLPALSPLLLLSIVYLACRWHHGTFLCMLAQ